MGTQQPMTPTDFHVLLVLSQGALYGYAIMKALDQTRIVRNRIRQSDFIEGPTGKNENLSAGFPYDSE